MDFSLVLLSLIVLLAALLINFFLTRAAVRQGIALARADEAKLKRQRERDGTA